MSDRETLKVAMTANHSDEVSGTSILNDGTKVFWSEGRSEHCQILYPDGRYEETAAYVPGHFEHPVIVAINEAGRTRTMTLVEEHEWNLARNGMLVPKGGA